jgi:hypothetical protein
MERIIITVTMIIAFLSSCSSNNERKSNEKIKNQTSLKIPDFTKSFEGSINKIGIIMILTKKNTSLNGTYSYKSKGIPIKISGKIDNTGNLKINEFNNNGSMTGIFKGRLIGTNINGKWEKPDGSKIIPFSISESENTETYVEKPTKSGIANFYSEGDNCHLNFTFNPGSIQVSEYDCENWRGSSCGAFDGWYNKK